MADRPLLTAHTIDVIGALTDGEWTGVATIHERTQVTPDELFPILARLEFWGWVEQKTVHTGDGNHVSGARLRPGAATTAANVAFDTATPETCADRDTVVGYLGAQHVTFVAGVSEFLFREPEPWWKQRPWRAP